MEPLIAIAILTPLPERAAELEAALREAVRASHTEEGCQIYALHRTVTEPTALVMVEQWATQEALDGHMAGTALQAVLSVLQTGLALPPQVLRLAAIPEGDSKLGQLVP